jgi:hypothetical protein
MCSLPVCLLVSPGEENLKGTREDNEHPYGQGMPVCLTVSTPEMCQMTQKNVRATEMMIK